jgi:hypothetical protein
VTPESAPLQLIAVPTVQLEVAVKDKDGNPLDREVEWSSNREDIATVDDGLVTAVGEGVAIITASSGGESDFATITVERAPVDDVLVEPASLQLEPGDTEELTVTLHDANDGVLTGRTVTYSSDDEDVATVNGDGLVTAEGAGEATITVESEGMEAEVAVEVVAPAVPEDQYEDNDERSSATDLSVWHGVRTEDDLLEIVGTFDDPGSDTSDWYVFKVTENHTPAVCTGPWEPLDFTATLAGIPEGSNYDIAAVFWRFEDGPFVPWGSMQTPGNASEVFSKSITGNCAGPSAFEFLVHVSHVSGPAGAYTLSMVFEVP